MTAGGMNGVVSGETKSAQPSRASANGSAAGDEWVLKRKICHHCQRGEIPLTKMKFECDGERYNELLCQMCSEALAPSQIDRLNHPAFVLAEMQSH